MAASLRNRCIGTSVLLLATLAPIAPAAAQTPQFELPIRWCAIAGSPAANNPGAVGEADTDGVLWRRQERLSDQITIPQSGVTWRSAIVDNIIGPGNFPVVADQNTTVGAAGDMIHPALAPAEYNATINACITAWNAILPAAVGTDIGVIALNVNQIVNADGSPRTTLGTVAGAGFGARRLILEDTAYTLGGSTLAGGTFDNAESTLGHEILHSLPTGLTAATNTVGFRHSCPGGNTFNTNLMSPTLGDLGTDNVWDQLLLGTSALQATANGPDGNHCTADDVFETVNQRTLLAQTAPFVPGCRLFGTTTPCSTRSTVAADDVADHDEGGLDISLVTVTDPEERDSFDVTLETFLPIDEKTFAGDGQFLAVLDLDVDPGTGAAPSDLGVPIPFEGAELLLSGQLRGENELEITAFVGSDGEWNQTERITGLLLPNLTIVEVFEPDVRDDLRAITSHTISWTVPDALLGPLGSSLRIAALTRPDAGDGTEPLDQVGTEEGLVVGLEIAEFATCTVDPDPAPAGGLAEVTVEGLRPDAPVHALIGPEEAGTGRTDAEGRATVQLRVPADSRGGTRLVTVGVDGTALTADCPMVVDDEAQELERRSGPNRVATATAISERVHPGSETVVIARSDDYADALVGGPLATRLGAPILLTPGDGLADATAAEIERLGASSAVLLGGQSALGQAVVDDLENLELTVRRIGGPDRFATARLVADEQPDVGEYLLAEGRNADPNRGWPDGVSAASLGAAAGVPVLLTLQDRLPAATAAALGADDDVTIIGGTAAVSEAVANEVDMRVADVNRISGPTRYATSAAVADEALGRGASAATTWVATGRDWPDALVVSAAVGTTRGVSLLVDGKDLAGSPETATWVDDNAAAIRSLRIVGGTAAVSDEVATALRDRLVG